MVLQSQIFEAFFACPNAIPRNQKGEGRAEETAHD